jgi:hypothetical protein
MNGKCHLNAIISTSTSVFSVSIFYSGLIVVFCTSQNTLLKLASECDRNTGIPLFTKAIRSMETVHS